MRANVGFQQAPTLWGMPSCKCICSHQRILIIGIFLLYPCRDEMSISIMSGRQLLTMQLYSCLCLTSNLVVAYTRYMNGDKDAIFKALGDSNRRLILDELSERSEMTLYELTVRLIMKHGLTISRQAIAKHLSILEDAGLVKSEKKGKYRVIIFNNEPLKNLLKGWIE